LARRELAEQKAQAWQKPYRDMRAKYTMLLLRKPRRVTGQAEPRIVGRAWFMKRRPHRFGWQLAAQLLALLLVPLAATAHESRLGYLALGGICDRIRPPELRLVAERALASARTRVSIAGLDLNQPAEAVAAIN
jgi:hypothetical protein